MHNSKHQWALFQKGRVRIKACASCGEMKLPSNVEDDCGQTNILSSPMVKAGYTLVEDITESEEDSDSQQVA